MEERDAINRDGDEESLEAAVQDVLSPGFTAQEVPGLSEILANGELIEAFAGLFRGSYSDILLRILVLSLVRDRGGRGDWAPDEIRNKLSFLTPLKVENTLTRLRSVGLLVYENGAYRMSPKAVYVLAAWDGATNFRNEKFGELGFVSAQIAGSAETIGVPETHLKLALMSTENLRVDIERAIATRSLDKVRETRNLVQEAFKWVKTGSELLARIGHDENMSRERRETGRALADSQSRLLGINPQLDKIIHQMESQRVRLGESGLSTTDIHHWLKSLAIDELTGLAALDVLAFPLPGFIRADLAVDNAEEVLEDELQLDDDLPPAQDAPDQELTDSHIDTSAFDNLLDLLTKATAPIAFTEIVRTVPFREASYRLSLLTLLSEKGSLTNVDPAAKLAPLGLDVTMEDVLESLDRGEVAQVTRGRIDFSQNQEKNYGQ